MLILYETPAGYALFKMKDDSKLNNPDDLYKCFENAETANKAIKLKSFDKFENTTDALAAVSSLVEGKLSKNLKSFLKREISGKDMEAKLAVGDSKLAVAISKKLGLNVISDSATSELIRGIRSQVASLISGLPESDMNAMALGLSHSLSRYKLKFSPDKVDTMIVQAIALLDDLDKELNTYTMRVKEWYGWHFPEMGKVLVDNLAYAKVVKIMGFRTNASNTDFSSILPEELETEIKTLAEVSMGTEISEEDIENITFLCDQIISISEYRHQLYDYLKNRMITIAPNLTALVGELVGARLIAHAGSLLNLAKQPASTVQILGAEKALFRALKAKHDTPKYGLIYHASLVGQSGSKIKGKIARLVASKTALAVRCDALGEGETPNIGADARICIEKRLAQLEGRAIKSSNSYSGMASTPKFEMNEVKTYNTSSDMVKEKKKKSKDGESEKKPKDGESKKKRKSEGKSEDVAAEGSKKKKKSKSVASQEA